MATVEMADTGQHDAQFGALPTALYEIDHGPPCATPSHVGRYEIRDVLGTGAMGVVYRAHDPDLHRAVAIKLVRGNSPSSHVRVLREAQAMARLHHPNVVPIFDVGPTDNGVFLAMPLLEGGTLRSWLDDGARSLDAILDRLLAAGRGLAAAHAAGLVHRDFKPDNVLLGAEGEVHVADFGLARLVDADPTPAPTAIPLTSGALTQTGAVLGTPAYMAPEQLCGRPIDARADQFSFCVSLWESLYGERPFPSLPADRPVRARVEAIAQGPTPVTRRDRPAWLASLLARGLAVDPDRRWPSVEALLDAIAARRAPRRWPRRLWAALGALVAAAALATVARPATAALFSALVSTEPPPAYTATPLAHYDDLQAASISPDGAGLAYVTRGSLVIQQTGRHAASRTVIDHGILGPIAWSPDSRHLLVGAASEHPGVLETRLVDTDDGTQRALPMTGMATFLSSTEIGVVTSYRHRSIAIYRVGGYAAPAARCDVPGEFTFLWNLAGLPDGTMIVETGTLDGEGHSLTILGRDCRVRAAFSRERLTSFAVTDTGTVVALVLRDPAAEILEISLDGALLSRHRVGGALGELLGRRHGTDYVTTLTPRTHLLRVKDGAPRLVSSTSANASFQLAPDGKVLARIERDGRDATPGPLWLSTFPDTSSSRAVLDDAMTPLRALTVGWSPDGRRLAVLVTDDPRSVSAAPRPGDPASISPSISASISLMIVDPSGGEPPRRVALSDLDRDAAPVWLDDDRIAARTGDRTTYRWVDLKTGAQGELGDHQHGSTLWLTRSPVDGTLAMWIMGAPGAIDARTEHLWLQRPGGAAWPLHVTDRRHFLVPSWSASGELLVRALEDGVVSRVALDTGVLTPIAQLAPTPFGRLFDDHLMPLADGDVLAVQHELGANVAVVRLDDAPRTRALVEPARPPR